MVYQDDITVKLNKIKFFLLILGMGHMAIKTVMLEKLKNDENEIFDLRPRKIMIFQKMYLKSPKLVVLGKKQIIRLTLVDNILGNI